MVTCVKAVTAGQQEGVGVVLVEVASSAVAAAAAAAAAVLTVAGPSKIGS